MKSIIEYINEGRMAGNYSNEDIEWMFTEFKKTLKKSNVKSEKEIDEIFNKEIRHTYENDEDLLFKKADISLLTSAIKRQFVSDIKPIVAWEWIGNKMRDKSVSKYNALINGEVCNNIFMTFTMLNSKPYLLFYYGEK